MSDRKRPDETDRTRAGEPDGNAQHRRPSYGAAGGEDSSPFEGVPSGELHEAAAEPQNAEPGSGD